MKDRPIETGVDAIIRSHPRYRLTPFAEILRELLARWGSIDGLAGLDCLELGPGTRVEMMRFLQDEGRVQSIRGVGRSVVWPWVRRRAFLRTHVMSYRFLEFFKRDSASSYDLIYSRHVMEQHAIDPWILLSSAAYWAQFKKKVFTDFDVSYPASPPNVRATFTAAWKALRPGGLIVSQIGKRTYGCLDEAFMATLHPRPVAVTRRDLGALSAIVTLLK